MQLQKLLCEYVYSLRVAKSQGSFKADEHHIVSTVDCAGLDMSMIAVSKIYKLNYIAIYRLAEKVTSPKILCATGSPLLRMLLSSISSSNKLGNRWVTKVLSS